MTFIVALRHDGIAAPCLFDGPINGAAFSPGFKRPWSLLKLGDIWTISAAIVARLCGAPSARLRDASFS